MRESTLVTGGILQMDGGEKNSKIQSQMKVAAMQMSAKCNFCS